MPPRGTAPRQTRHSHRAATISMSIAASSQMVRTRNVRQAVSRRPVSTPDSSPMRTDTPCTATAPRAAASATTLS